MGEKFCKDDILLPEHEDYNKSTHKTYLSP